MEDKSDMLMAIDALEDEVEGVESYGEILDNAKCPELKKMVAEILAEEKTHVNALLKWINANNK